MNERKARSELKRWLLEEDWSPETVDQVLAAIEMHFDGFWSWGTARMMKDLGRFYAEMVKDHGEAPDRVW